MTHLSTTLPDRIEKGALRSEEWSTDIITTDGGVERRESRWTASLRSYDVSLPITTRVDEDYIAMRALYAEAKGNLHSFSFNDWSDDTIVAVRFDGPMQLTGITPDLDQIGTFRLVEVKDAEAV